MPQTEPIAAHVETFVQQVQALVYAEVLDMLKAAFASKVELGKAPVAIAPSGRGRRNARLLEEVETKLLRFIGNPSRYPVLTW